ncbi:MAG: hypothetical protein JWM07_49 [Candidatus Saccharibacteria bacterium]|nr:hypothetical protein [Candidatus Saccharibacteria bacterium]
MPDVNLLWIEDVKPGDNNYAEKQRLLDHFNRLYDVRGRRLRRPDARLNVRSDYVRLLMVLRWMMMDRRSSAGQMVQLAEFYAGSTPSAKRWYKKFLRSLIKDGVITLELMSHMRTCASKISL